MHMYYPTVIKRMMIVHISYQNAYVLSNSNKTHDDSSYFLSKCIAIYVISMESSKNMIIALPPICEYIWIY